MVVTALCHVTHRSSVEPMRGGRGSVTAWEGHPLIAREAKAYASQCACSQRIEAGRAELHRTLDSVLVIDMRMNWNGIGPSRCARTRKATRLERASGSSAMWFVRAYLTVLRRRLSLSQAIASRVGSPCCASAPPLVVPPFSGSATDLWPDRRRLRTRLVRPSWQAVGSRSSASPNGRNLALISELMDSTSAIISSVSTQITAGRERRTGECARRCSGAT